MGGLFYQHEAYQIVDYDLWRIDGSEEMFRGPQMVLRPGGYVAYIGAAQTFGTFCRFPFASLVSERVGRASANLGIGGAGPMRFLLDKTLMKTVNEAGIAVVQVMSGRSVGNSLYENLNGTSSLRPRADPKAPWVWAERVWDELCKTQPREKLSQLVDECRANWVDEMRQLLSAISAPKILLWFSARAPKHNFSFENADKLLGPFPHLVNDVMIDAIKADADEYVEVISDRGLPQQLYDRFTGERTYAARPNHPRVYINGGYPTPEMHVDAAEKLAPVIDKFWRDPRVVQRAKKGNTQARG